jgi:hypothetical protein
MLIKTSAIVGSLLGTAIGDAIGLPTEFSVAVIGTVIAAAELGVFGDRFGPWIAPVVSALSAKGLTHREIDLKPAGQTNPALGLGLAILLQAGVIGLAAELPQTIP